MPHLILPRTLPGALLCIAALWLTNAGHAAAQQPASSPRPNESSTSTAPQIETASLPPSADPFTELERENSAGKTTSINFARTPLDTKAEATAQVVQRGQTLLVRMRAKNIPVPSHFEVPRYAVWVYVPNYQVKMYIGDLPVVVRGRSKRGDGPRRGESDTAYRFTRLPLDAVFGGLAVTAEPIRFTPIVNDALRPVLVGLLPKEDAAGMLAATTIYSGPVPADRQPKPSEGSASTPKSN